MNPPRHPHRSVTRHGKVRCTARQEMRTNISWRKRSRNCVSKSGRGVGFSGSTRTLYGEGRGWRSYKEARGERRERTVVVRGSSPWNFNQRQLLAGVACSPYVRTFLETQNSIFPPFSPLGGSLSLHRVDLAARASSRHCRPRLPSLLQEEGIIGGYCLEREKVNLSPKRIHSHSASISLPFLA